MKKLIFVLAISIISFSCKKKTEPTPAVDNTDYADSLAGSYLGTQIVYQADNSTQKFYNANATITVTKLSMNKVRVVYYYSPYTANITYDLSNRWDGNILLSPEGYTAYGTGNNVYFISPAKQLNMYIKNGAPNYFYFQGVKQ